MSQDPAAAPRGASALTSRGFRWYFAFATAAVMADNVEHVISYWVMFQKFHSPVMGGFAVISHWVPHLLFAAWSGALADRVDVRRLIQVGMGILALVSVGWGWLFQTDSVEMWKAAALLIAHGMAGVFWLPASQVLIHQLVDRERLPSAVRLNATSRYVGFLAGPALGAALLMGLGPKWGIWVNALLYAPMALLMLRIRYSGPRRAQPRDVRGIADILVGMRAVAAHPVLLSMTALIAASSFFIGSAYQAQMPGFAASLGRANADFLYSLLLAADAAGGLTAGVLLETRPLMQPRTRTAFVLAITWAVLLAGFAPGISLLPNPDREATTRVENWQTWTGGVDPATETTFEGLTDYDASHRRAVRDWLDAIRDSREPLASGERALKAIEMAHGIFTAGLSGERVAFPLVRRTHPLIA